MAKAALKLCRAWRVREGVQDGRFYWVDWDKMVMLVNSLPGTVGAVGEVPEPAVAQASRELQDLARLTDIEALNEAALGEQAYVSSKQ